MHEYWTNRKYTNSHDFEFLATSLFLLQGHNVTSNRTSPNGPEPQNQHRKRFLSHKSGMNNVRSGSTLSPSASTKNTLGMPMLAVSHTPFQPSPAYSDPLLLLIAILNELSSMNNAVYCKMRLSENHKTLQCIFIPGEMQNALTSFRNANYKHLSTRPMR